MAGDKVIDNIDIYGHMGCDTEGNLIEAVDLGAKMFLGSEQCAISVMVKH